MVYDFHPVSCVFSIPEPLRGDKKSIKILENTLKSNTIANNERLFLSHFTTYFVKPQSKHYYCELHNTFTT